MNQSSKTPRKYTLPVICGKCEKRMVIARRNRERVLIHCEGCGERIFAYYTDPTRQKQRELPPESEDAFIIKQVERELLREVSEVASTVYIYIRRYRSHHGYAPTRREIQRAFSWNSLASVQHHIEQLERAGLIERDYGAARGLRLPHADVA